MTLVPSGSQRMELQRRGFERLNLLSAGSTANSSIPPGAIPNYAGAGAWANRTSPCCTSAGWRREEPRPARRHLPRALRRPSAAEAAPGTGGRRAGAQAPRTGPARSAVLRRPARRNPGRPLRLGRPVPSSQACRRPTATWSSKPRPPASRWSPSTKPPPASTSAMGTTACSPRRATKRLRRSRQLAAGRPGTPAPGPSQRPPTRQPARLGQYRRALPELPRTPAPVRWSSPLGRSPSGRRQRMAGPCHAAASSSQAKAFGVAMKPRLMAPAPRLMPPVGLSMPRCKWMSRSRQAFSNAAKPGRSRSAVGSPA